MAQLPTEVHSAARTALAASPASARVPQIRGIEQDVKRLTRAANRAKKLAAAAVADEEVEEYFDAPTGAPETGVAVSGLLSSVSSTPVGLTPAPLITPSASTTPGDTPGIRSPLVSLASPSPPPVPQDPPSAPPVSLLCRVFDALMVVFVSG